MVVQFYPTYPSAEYPIGRLFHYNNHICDISAKDTEELDSKLQLLGWRRRESWKRIIGCKHKDLHAGLRRNT